MDRFDDVERTPRNTIISGIKVCVDAHYETDPLPYRYVKSTYPYAKFPEPCSAREQYSFSYLFNVSDSGESPYGSDTDLNISNRFEDITREVPTVDPSTPTQNGSPY